MYATIAMALPVPGSGTRPSSRASPGSAGDGGVRGAATCWAKSTTLLAACVTAPLLLADGEHAIRSDRGVSAPDRAGRTQCAGLQPQIHMQARYQEHVVTHIPQLPRRSLLCQSFK